MDSLNSTRLITMVKKRKHPMDTVPIIVGRMTSSCPALRLLFRKAASSKRHQSRCDQVGSHKIIILRSSISVRYRDFDANLSYI